MKRKRVISFSLWGETGTHLKHAIWNVEVAKEIYPDWVCRFYVASDVPFYIIDMLQNQGAEVFFEEQKYGEWEGLFWRFYPAADPKIDYMIVRDADSLLSWREKAAVDEWIESGQPFHIMRDNYQHNARILGGMWGAKGGLFPNLKQEIEDWITNANGGKVVKGDDQIFLHHIVWPSIWRKHLAHDSFFLEKYNSCDSRPFPPHKENHKYVPFIGNVIDDSIADEEKEKANG